MSLVAQIAGALTRVGTEFKALRLTIGLLGGLTTTDKSSVVAAINEVKGQVAGSGSGDMTKAQYDSNFNGKVDRSELADSVPFAGITGFLRGPNVTQFNQLTLRATDIYTNAFDTTVEGFLASISSGTVPAGNSSKLGGVAASDYALKSYVDSARDALRSELLGGTPAAAFDTLKEIADYIAGDQTATSGITTALGKRLRFDAVQSLTAGEQAQGLSNLGAASSADLATLSSNVGDTSTNFVTVFEAALV